MSDDAGATEYDYKGDADLMEVQPDVIGDQEMVLLTDEDFSLDWGAKRLGIDLGYGYRVKRIILYPTSVDETRISEDTIQIYISIIFQGTG